MAKKRKKRRRRGGLGRLLRPLSVLLAAVAVVTALTLFFKVEHITVTGAGRYQAGEIIDASGVKAGDNLVLLDRYRVAQRIYTALPYITDVRPKPEFPNSLNIEVTETRAVAAIGGAGAYWLVSGSGKLLEAVDAAAAADYLQIAGVETQEPAVSAPLRLPEDAPITADRLLELLAVLQQRGALTRSEKVDCGDPKILVLSYDGRFQVEMFYDANFDFKIAGMLEAVHEKLEPNETGIIRMTFSNDNEAHLIPFPE